MAGIVASACRGLLSGQLQRGAEYDRTRSGRLRSHVPGFVRWPLWICPETNFGLWVPLLACPAVRKTAMKHCWASQQWHPVSRIGVGKLSRDYSYERAASMVTPPSILIRHAVASVVVMSVLIADVTHELSRVVAADQVATIRLTDRVPYGREPVDYFGTTSSDAVSQLQRQLAAGKLRLSPDDRFGYLLSVLELLDVPLESQLLVYSKTARAPDLVSPQTPRAIFFNDEVSVAWIPESRELEITAVDPVKGVNFYTLSQPLAALPVDYKAGKRVVNAGENAASPSFLRRDRCLACHAGRSTLEIPGLLLRAFQTDGSGRPIVGFSRVTHDMRYEKRWGGWYVTGTPAGIIHRGNLLSEADNSHHKKEPGFASSLDELSQKFDVAGYPNSGSDLVAHLVLAHQVHGTNLLIRAGLEARLNRRSDVENDLVRYFVFADEPPLKLSQSAADAVLANSKFATSFVNRGPRDAKGNSLREFSLVGQVFKHRLSYLIYSRLFDELPLECRSRLLEKLWAGLTTESEDDGFEPLGSDERKSIIAIVRATVRRLPKCWAGGEGARQ
jgi:hypothetical protein